MNTLVPTRPENDNIPGDGKFDIPAIAGTSLTLSVSVELQNYGEELMQNKVGSVVAIEPETGEILAMISSPGYDPNLLIGREKNRNYQILNDDPAKVLYNRLRLTLI